MISTIAGEASQMSRRELFERVKELNESIDHWLPENAEDEDEYWNVRALMIRDYNEVYVLLFRRMFRKHKIYRINPNW